MVSACAATITVAGCAVLVVGMTRASSDNHPRRSTSPVAVAEPSTSIPAQLPASSHSVAPAHTAASTRAVPSRTATKSTPARTPSVSSTHVVAAPTTSARATDVAAPATTASTSKPAPKPSTSAHVSAPRKGQALPLHFATYKATRVITVVAHSHASTTATLQAWHKAPGGGWLRSGSSVTAHIGADGLSSSPSEFKSATPIGSFSLTQAFGRLSNPGTDLHYFKTRPSDWWISQSGPLYNTHQRCSSGCNFNQGSPNEHLYYETPYYNYAVVINTPSGSSAYPHGSAFFLHVTDYNPTAGCVAIPQSKLRSIMGWLHPAQHPRILIGVT